MFSKAGGTKYPSANWLMDGMVSRKIRMVIRVFAYRCAYVEGPVAGSCKGIGLAAKLIRELKLAISSVSRAASDEKTALATLCNLKAK